MSTNSNDISESTKVHIMNDTIESTKVLNTFKTVWDNICTDLQEYKTLEKILPHQLIAVLDTILPKTKRKDSREAGPINVIFPPGLIVSLESIKLVLRSNKELIKASNAFFGELGNVSKVINICKSNGASTNQLKGKMPTWKQLYLTAGNICKELKKLAPQHIFELKTFTDVADFTRFDVNVTCGEELRSESAADASTASGADACSNFNQLVFVDLPIDKLPISSALLNPETSSTVPKSSTDSNMLSTSSAADVHPESSDDASAASSSTSVQTPNPTKQVVSRQRSSTKKRDISQDEHVSRKVSKSSNVAQIIDTEFLQKNKMICLTDQEMKMKITEQEPFEYKPVKTYDIVWHVLQPLHKYIDLVKPPPNCLVSTSDSDALDFDHKTVEQGNGSNQSSNPTRDNAILKRFQTSLKATKLFQDFTFNGRDDLMNSDYSGPGLTLSKFIMYPEAGIIHVLDQGTSKVIPRVVPGHSEHFGICSANFSYGSRCKNANGKVEESAAYWVYRLDCVSGCIFAACRNALFGIHCFFSEHGTLIVSSDSLEFEKRIISSYMDDLKAAKLAQIVVQNEASASDGAGGPFVEEVYRTLLFSDPSITKAAIVKNVLDWKVEPGADCIIQMIQQNKHCMIFTAPRQYHEVHFLCNADARSTLRDRLSFEKSKIQMYKASRRLHVAANFAVADHASQIMDHITMLSRVHGTTHGLFEDIACSHDNAINKANVSHSIIGFLRYLSPLVGGIQEAAALTYETMMRLHTSDTTRCLLPVRQMSPLLATLMDAHCKAVMICKHVRNQRLMVLCREDDTVNGDSITNAVHDAIKLHVIDETMVFKFFVVSRDLVVSETHSNLYCGLLVFLDETQNKRVTITENCCSDLFKNRIIGFEYEVVPSSRSV